MSKTVIDFKEQMTEARRTQILMGAAQVFSQKGFYRATTKEIAQAAEVSEGTIYHYFQDKRELLIAMLERLGTWSLQSIISTDPPRETKEFLSHFLHDLYQLLQERSHFAFPILAEILTDTELRQAFYRQLVEPLAAYIEEAMQPHVASDERQRIEPMLLANTLVGALLLNFVLKSTGLEPRYEALSADALIEQIVSLFSACCYTDKELAWLRNS